MGSNIVIVNESANWQRSRAKARYACRLLSKQGFAFSLVTSEAPGHAADVAATVTRAALPKKLRFTYPCFLKSRSVSHHVATPCHRQGMPR